MEDAGLTTAAYWAPVLETIADIAFAVVIVALAVELVSGRIAKRFERQIDAARELQIAQLNNETVRLRKAMGPRQINADIFLKAVEGKPKAPVDIMFPKEDGEAFLLALQIRDLLRKAGWQCAEPIPIPATAISRLANVPPQMAAGGQPTGVAVVANQISDAESDSLMAAAVGKPITAWTPFLVLHAALLASLGALSASGGAEAAPGPGMLRIIVGPKP